MAVLVVSVLATTCGLGSEVTDESSSEPDRRLEETTDLTSDAAAPVEAETAYLRRCGGCHGAAGTEQAAQSLAEVASKPESWVRAKVMSGGGEMPAFGESLHPAEIDAIIAYVTASFP